jgi:hypothetical protein
MNCPHCGEAGFSTDPKKDKAEHKGYCSIKIAHDRFRATHPSTPKKKAKK